MKLLFIKNNVRFCSRLHPAPMNDNVIVTSVFLSSAVARCRQQRCWSHLCEISWDRILIAGSAVASVAAKAKPWMIQTVSLSQSDEKPPPPPPPKPKLQLSPIDIWQLSSPSLPPMILVAPEVVIWTIFSFLFHASSNRVPNFVQLILFAVSQSTDGAAYVLLTTWN